LLKETAVNFASFLQWLHDTHFSTVMRESNWAEPIVETVHVLALTLFFGFVVLLDLRLLGVVLKSRPITEVVAQLNVWLTAGYVIMIVTGILLFAGDPIAFWSTFPFKLKMVLLAVVGVNAVLFNVTIGKKIGEWDLTPNTPWAAKMSGIVSLVLWTAIIAAGRVIAYVLPPPM
jgi:hypothetical protein